MKSRIEEVLNDSKEYLSLEEICNKVNVKNKKEKEEIKKIIEEKVLNYDLYTQDNKYINLEYTPFRKGIFHNFHEKRTITLNGNIFKIEGEYVNNAIDGDEVLVYFPFLDNKFHEDPFQIEITKVINRNISYLTGTAQKRNNEFYFRPTDKVYRKLNIKLIGNNYKTSEPLLINLDHNQENLETNNYTIENAEKFNDQQKGEIDKEVEKFGIYKGFSKETLEEVKKLPKEVREEDKKGRADFTNWKVFTIDGENTKDIDDAISIYFNKDNDIVVGIHIADPSAYIEKGSSIYNEAISKGTSCYPTASKVYPMLPPELSSGICSLQENKERLTNSFILTFDHEGNVKKFQMVKGIIKSKKQMTYKKVNDLLEKNIVAEGYEDFKEELLVAAELAKKIHQRRKKRGNLKFENNELKIILDKNDKVKSMNTRIIGKSDELIEAFMVETGEQKALFCEQKDIACTFRNHGKASQHQIDTVIEKLNKHGYKFNEKIDAKDPKSVNKLLDFIKTNCTRKSEVKALCDKVLRCLPKAVFNTENKKHYALGSDGYSTGTSPIRKGPDFVDIYSLNELYFSQINSEEIGKEIENEIPLLANHSIKNLEITENINILSKEEFALVQNKCNNELNSLTMHFSLKEINAQNCARTIEKKKIAEAMKKEIGNHFNAIITRMNNSELTIELDNSIIGCIIINNMNGSYKYDDFFGYLKSLEGKEDYYIGDELEVIVKSANKRKGTVEFSIAKKIGENIINKKEIEKELKKVSHNCN